MRAAAAAARYNLGVRVPARHRWTLLWIVLAAVLVVRATARKPHRGVILDHLEFGRRLLHGDDVYAPWRSDLDAPLRPLHAPYPPSFGLLTAPFAIVHETFGLLPARAAWALLQVGALVVIARWLARAATSPRGPPPPRLHRWLLLGTLLLLSRFVLRDVHGGGGNVVNLALCVLAFAAAERDQRGDAARAGLWLGVSLATKPTQVWLLPVFVLLGHRRAAAHALVAGAGCVLLSLALLRFDAGPWLRWLEGSFALATQPDAFAEPALGFPAFEWMNQSLRCALARWFGEVPPELAERVVLLPPAGLGLDAATVGWLARAVGLALLGSLLATAARALRDARARTAVFAAALVLSLLLSPLSWKAHHAVLLPLVYLLLRDAVEQRSRGTIALLVAFALCCGIGGELLGDDLAEVLNSLYVVTAFDLVLFAAALRFARRGSRATQPPP